ncbi:hypothetical protein PSPO01_13375 [Paraphaeosphaeria sporulosa]
MLPQLPNAATVRLACLSAQGSVQLRCRVSVVWYWQLGFRARRLLARLASWPVATSFSTVEAARFPPPAMCAKARRAAKRHQKGGIYAGTWIGEKAVAERGESGATVRFCLLTAGASPVHIVASADGRQGSQAHPKQQARRRVSSLVARRGLAGLAGCSPWPAVGTIACTSRRISSRLIRATMACEARSSQRCTRRRLLCCVAGPSPVALRARRRERLLVRADQQAERRPSTLLCTILCCSSGRRVPCTRVLPPRRARTRPAPSSV